MMDTPAPPTEAPVTQAVLDQMLRTALHDLVTVDMMRPLVKQEVDLRFDFTRQQISAIDAAQRLAFEQFNGAANRIQTSADTFQATARELKESVGGLKATDAAQAQDITDIKDTIESIKGWMQGFEARLSKTENQQNSLHMDIHGSPTETNRENVFTAIGRLGMKIDDKFTGVNTRLDQMETKLDKHDAYIVRRQKLEALIWKQLVALWSNKVYRYGLYLLGISVVGILGLNTPPGLDLLGHAIKLIGAALAGGK